MLFADTGEKEILGMKRCMILMAVLLLGLCACGKAKSAEAVKADELIQSIGQVSLESETSIKLARTYYDSLTEKQQNEVESYSTLISAETEWDRLSAEKAAEEQARQEAERNAQLYAKAVEYDELNMIDEAYELYAQLPEGYEDVQARMEAITPYVGICGTWICDVQLAKAKNGKEWRPLYSELTIRIDKRTDAVIVFTYDAKTTTVDSKHMLFNRIDMWAAMTHDKGWFWNCTVQLDGSRVFEEQETLGSTGMGSLREQFTFQDGNKMIMTARINKFNIDVSFPYTKKK